jgi:hypothetical protein
MIARNQIFNEVTISMDGGSFYDCTFNRCKLRVSGLLPVTLEGGSFNDCNWELIGPAANILTFLAGLYKLGARDLIEGAFRLIRGEQVRAPITVRH